MTQASRLGVLKDPNCLYLFIGQLISQVCDKLALVGLIWIITSEFDATLVPWFIGIGGLAHLLVTPFAEKIISKIGTLKIIIGTDIFRGILFIISGLIIFNLSGNNKLIIATFFILHFISNLAGALFNPAILSIPVKLVKEDMLQKLNALIDSCFSIGNIVGPALAIVAYKFAGVGGMLIVNGASFIISAFLEMKIKIPENKKIEEATDNTTTSSGFIDVLRRNQVIGWMLGVFLSVNLFLGPITLFLPIYAKEIYGASMGGFAFLETAIGIGTVLGGLVLTFIKLPFKSWLNIFISMMFCSVFYLSFTISSNLFVGGLSVVFLGLFLATANVVIIEFFQTKASGKDVLKIMSLVNLITVSAYPVSMLLTSLITQVITVKSYATICALLVVSISFAILLIPNFRNVKEESLVPSES